MSRLLLQLRPIIFSLLFVIGQMGVVVHAAQHIHHHAQASCASFLSAEQSALPAISDAYAQVEIITAAVITNPLFSVSLNPFTPYQTRAPPIV